MSKNVLFIDGPLAATIQAIKDSNIYILIEFIGVKSKCTTYNDIGLVDDRGYHLYSCKIPVQL